MSITGQVIVQATTAHIFKLAIRDVGFSTFNERLDGVEPRNWRSVDTPATNPLIDLFKKHMEYPVEFVVEKGIISTIKISAEEPQWSVNFKKALLATLKIQLRIEGKCENTYQVSELPEYLIHEVEQGMIKPELCKPPSHIVHILPCWILTIRL